MTPKGFSDYEWGVLDGVRQSLKALDGHGPADTAHDRVRRLLACGECFHLPEQHRDGEECLATVFVPGPPPMPPCECAEYEAPAFHRGRLS